MAEVIRPGTAAFLLLSLGREARATVEARLRPDELTLRHLSALGHLRSGAKLSYSELARRAGVTPQSMQATLLQLEERGAVRRGAAAGRGRRAQLELTPLGHDLLDRGTRALAATEDDLLARLTPAQRTQLVGILSALRPPPGS